MFGGINPKKLQGMMKQMGIAQEEVEAERVIIEKTDGKIIIENPSVSKVKMQGQETWQISGEEREESAEEPIREEDIKLVAEKTGKSKEEARKALEETGEIAEAIMWLSG
jgi:nascent polypeptide-associated complex subunit alpha